MNRIAALTFIALLAACSREPQLVNGGDELSPFVGQSVADATTGFSRAGYRLVGETEEGLYWLNRRSQACARVQFAQRRLISVVQLPTAACQTVSR